MEKNTTFLKPTTGFPMADFQQHIMEIILNLHLDLGTPETVDDTMFRMFELALPHASPDEILAFAKVIGASRCINRLVHEDHESYKDLIEEQLSYVNT